MGQGPCGEQSVGRPTRFARLPYVLGPFVTPLAKPRKRVRRRGLALRVTRRFSRGHDAEANASFCHARVAYSIGQERRATATGTLGAIQSMIRVREGDGLSGSLHGTCALVATHVRIHC
jgi:hypothetical protein